MAGRRPRLGPLPRRSFLRYSLFGAVSAGLGGFGLASLGFAWPRTGGRLTGEVSLGDAEVLADQIRSSRAPVRVTTARVSVVLWDPSIPAARRSYGEHHRAILDDTSALMAIDTFNCPHLGCAVPWCQSSQWFECPCHASRYNRWGEWTDGPAPRGMDRYASRIDEETGAFVVDLGTHVTGPARTDNALTQGPEGPACVDL